MDQEARANAIIATMLDDTDMPATGNTMEYLLTDVDDWEALALELASASCGLLTMVAHMMGSDPYEIWMDLITDEV